MNAILLLTLLGSITDPVPAPAWLRHEPVPPPISPTVIEAEHSGQPITVPQAVPLIQGVPFDRRLPGPMNWFRCPWCDSSTDLMLLGQHLLENHKISNDDLNCIGHRQFSMFDDNLHNKDWKPSISMTKDSSCEGGNCQPARLIRGLRRWR